MFKNFKRYSNQQKTILFITYGILFFGIVYLLKDPIKNINLKQITEVTQREPLYNEYEFPEGYMIWTSDDKTGFNNDSKYKFQKNNKKVRIQAGTKVIILKREGATYFNRTQNCCNVQVYFTYKILKNNFVSKVSNDRVNWYYDDFDKLSINFVGDTSTVPVIRMWEMLGGTTEKIADLRKKTHYERIRENTEEDVQWLKVKEATRRLLNSSNLIVTNVDKVEITDGEWKEERDGRVNTENSYFGQSPDFNRKFDLIAQSAHQTPDELVKIFEKIKKDEPELLRRYQNMVDKDKKEERKFFQNKEKTKDVNDKVYDYNSK